MKLIEILNIDYIFQKKTIKLLNVFSRLFTKSPYAPEAEKVPARQFEQLDDPTTAPNVPDPQLISLLL